MNNSPETKVSGKFGAPLGRPTLSGYFDRSGEWVELQVLPHAQPFSLRRVRLDRGGYDQGGAYWGLGFPLYYFEGPLSDICGYVRATSRETAKAQVRLIHPHARFYR